MLASIVSPSGLIILFSIFGIGGIGTTLLRGNNRAQNLWAHIFSITGALWGLIFAASALISNREFYVNGLATSFPFLSLSFHIDKLSSLFIIIICLSVLFCSIYGIGYVKSFYGRYNVGNYGFFYNLFIAAMLAVVTSSNGILFLFAWEIMSLASYFLVVYERHDHKNVKAGYLYLIMTHAATALITLAFILLFNHAHSFDFNTIRASVPSMSMALKNIVFLLAFVGFGTKAGIIPFHIWLPAAHPAAPSHVSALMSGVMIKTGIYMMIRLFLGILLPIPLWWGLTLIIVGSISCVLGVLYALTEHDIKRLLAYHSIENIGIILLGLGGAMVFYSLHLPTLMLLSLAAALFHTWNHATFKSLLFLAAGSVALATGTKNIEKYGGLIKSMPQTAILFLIGAMAISALPPFNGFYSEWLTFQSLIHGVLSGDILVKWVFLGGLVSLALAGGLALACFVKAFGSTFLARPRSVMAKGAKEVSIWMRSGMAGLAVLCLVLGVASAYIIKSLESLGREITASPRAGLITSVSSRQTLQIGHNFGSISAPFITVVAVATPLLVWFVSRYFINRHQKITSSPTWDCGTDITPRMEITSTGFARSLTMIFQPLLRSNLSYDTAPAGSLAPTSIVATVGIVDIYKKYIYGRMYSLINILSIYFKKIQNGNINAYILYILLALIIALAMGI
jgi:hydrogenase-4 component B